MIKKIVLLAVAGMLLAACSGSDSPTISDARMGQPTGPNGGVFFTAEGYGTADRLIGATTDVAREVQVHETLMNDDGTMGMNEIGAVDLPADGELVLEPGGLHLMLMDVDRLEVGEEIDMVLQWENAGDMEIRVEVVDPSETARG